MFDSKNVISKYVGYFLVGFFLLIIILSFGMPDLGLNCGSDPTSVAVVNGQRVHHLDFIRYRDTKFRQYKDKKMTGFILDNYIMEIMMLQKAEAEGFDATEEKISRYIKTSRDFRNPATGKYDPQLFQMVLRNNRMSFMEFSQLLKRDMQLSDFRFMMSAGTAVATEDVKKKYIADNSKIRIKYAHLATKDMRKRFSKDLAVSEKDIDQEISSKKVAIKDPKTDRARIKKELEDKKLEAIKKSLIERINKVASAGGSFSSASSLLGGKTGTTSTFKIGGRITLAGQKGGTIPAIENSKIFMDNCLAMKVNSSSQVIDSARGLYIFTPISRVIPDTASIKEKDFQNIENTLAYTGMNTMMRNLLKSLNEKSKISKNLKTD